MPSTSAVPMAPRVRDRGVSAGRRVSSPSQRRQHHTVPLTTSQLDDEQRLAALWEHDVDDDESYTASHEDARATLFASACDTATAAHTTRPRRRRSARPQQSRVRTRPPRRAQPRRLAGAAISVLAALAVVIVTDGTPTGTPSDDTSKPTPQAVHTVPAPTTPAHIDRPDRTGTTRRRTRTPSAPQQTERPKRRPAQTSRGDRKTRRDRPLRRPTARPPAARPSRPPAAPPVPPPVATSSACDEFPPC
jgi:hypothetical protein